MVYWYLHGTLKKKNEGIKIFEIGLNFGSHVIENGFSRECQSIHRAQESGVGTDIGHGTGRDGTTVTGAEKTVKEVLQHLVLGGR